MTTAEKIGVLVGKAFVELLICNLIFDRDVPSERFSQIAQAALETVIIYSRYE